MKYFVFLLLHAGLLTPYVSGQEFIVESRVRLSRPNTLIASASGWVAASNGSTVAWSTNGGHSWRSISGQSLDPHALALVGDSRLILADAFLFGIAAEQDSIGSAIRPPNALTSAFVGTDEMWLAGGRFGVSRSIDSGKNWSPVDSIFTKSCCAGQIRFRQLRQGPLVAFAHVGLSEMNEVRLLYSVDNGISWSDSSAVGQAHFSPETEILSGRSHVEIHFHSTIHAARRTWGDPFVQFSSSVRVWSSTYSDQWGVVVATDIGLLRLDEFDLSWHPLGPSMPTRHVAAGPEGRLWVADRQQIFLFSPHTPSGAEPDSRVPQLELYPNPAGTLLNIKGMRPGDRYDIVDLLGRRHFVTTSAETETSISLAGLAPGLYFIRPRNLTSAAGMMFVLSR